jgi:phenylalanyl-tRNA synthetase alpha chain
MDELLKQIQQYTAAIEAASPSGREQVEAFRIQYLGTKGIVKSLMGSMKDIQPDQRKAAGQALNEFKKLAEAKLESLQDANESAGEDDQKFDLSLPGDFVGVGTRHPLSIVRGRIVSIFKKLGFAIAEGPDIEDDWHNFGAMNLPEDHPARDMQDTFYISQNPSWLLRTHMSSVQARVMESQKPPIRVICPGRVYRNETISARAHCFFHQVEGLYIAENVSFADLKQTLYFFVQEMFGKEVKVRFRPSYFPFKEPSA